MKRRIHLTLAALAAAWACPAAASAAILLSDTFADGDRTNTSLPSDSAVYSSVAADTTTVPGGLSFTQSTGSRRLHTHFAANGSPVQLAVGDKLLATIDFIPRGAVYDSTSRNFRFGLFHDATSPQVTVDGANDSGGAGSPWADSLGYAVFMPLSGGPATTQQFQIGKRTGSGNLMGSTGDYTQAGSGGGMTTVAVGTQYTATMLLHKVSASQTDITVELKAGATVLASQTVSDDGTALGAAAPYDNFDQLAFRFSAATGTADVLEFKRFEIEHTPIPEPSALLLSLGGLAALAMGRRR